jgi:hypothetical protein
MFVFGSSFEGLREQCEIGKRMVFTEKHVIHPCQVPVIQEAYLPSKDAITWVQGLVRAFYGHQEHGQVSLFLACYSTEVKLVNLILVSLLTAVIKCT